MGLLDWRIKRLEAKKKKLLAEREKWRRKLRQTQSARIQNDVLWILSYIGYDLQETREKLRKLKRKKKCKAEEQ